MQSNAMQFNPMQCNAIQCSAVQCHAIYHTTLNKLYHITPLTCWNETLDASKSSLQILSLSISGDRVDLPLMVVCGLFSTVTWGA